MSNWTDLLGQAVSGFAQSNGKSISADAVSAIAQELATLCATLVSNEVKKQAQKDADAAAGTITTMEGAEADAFKRR